MKQPRVATALAVFTLVGIGISGAALMQTWRLRAAAIGHQLSIAPLGAWGFYRLKCETLAAYPAGQPDHNMITDLRQHGPVTDVCQYPVCAVRGPACLPVKSTHSEIASAGTKSGQNGL